jgi:fibronectin type 3 domain-containing protein
MERFRVGLGIYNVGQQVKFISVGDPLPTTARLGLAYQVLDIPHHSLLLSVDNGFDLNSSSYIGAGGMEYWFDKTLALRVGYTGDAYQQHMTAGVGVNVDVVEFDYAFSPMGTLGDTHRFSLMVHLDSGEIMGLAAPRGFSAQPMDGAVNLRWSPASSSSVVGYNLYLKKPGAQGLTLVNKKRPINDTSVQLNQLFNGQNYTFALTSVSAAGRESGMAQVSVVPGVAGGAIQGTALPAPTGFRAALNGQGCDLFWDKSASADIVGYNLYLVNPNQAPRKLSNQPVTQTPVNIISLKPGQTYSFYLTAVNKTGNESPASTVLNVSLAGLQNASAPSFKAPAHLKLQKEGQKVHLSWDSAAGAVKYNIYVSHDGTNFKLLTSDGLAKTEALLGPLKAGMPYIFGVSTVSAAGQESDKALLTLPAQ